MRPLHLVLALASIAACDRPPADAAKTAPPAQPDPANTVKPEPVAPTTANPPGHDLVAPIPPPAMVEEMQAQLVLDHPRVAPYLHTEVPANLPLRLAPSPDLAQGSPSLRVAGQPVKIVAPADARFIFKGLEKQGGPRVRIRFEIPPEGVSGHVDLELADYVWSAIDVALIER